MRERSRTGRSCAARKPSVARSRALAVVGGIAIGAIALSPGSAKAEVYACAGNAVRVFADDAATTDQPVRIIQSSGLLSECYGIALDNLHHEIWVSTGTSASAFRAGANGDVPPLRSISGTGGGLGFVVSLAVDVEADELFVGSADGRVSVFPRTADGPTATLRTIDGDNTGLNNSGALFVDRLHDELYVANFNAAPSVSVFSRTANGDVPSSRSFGAFASIIGMVVDPRAEEVFLGHGTGEVAKFTLGGSALPSLVGLTAAYGLALNVDGQLLVANQSAVATDTDWIYSLTRNPGGLFTFNVNGAPASWNIWGIASSRSLNCAEGNVAGSCLFRDGFERGDRQNWSASVP